MKEQIKKTKDIVKEMLETIPRTRDDDAILVCMVFDKLGKNWRLPFGDVMLEVSKGRLPSFETISRCRRKIQEEFPELRGEIYEQRNELQEDYKNLAKGDI